MKKEITIAYGKEIQLTTIGKKNKQVFLKFSPAFKNKQLKELKGASLSVFLCYALHSNDEGYCWIDSLLVEKETGYSKKAIIKARQFLKEKGYLFYERLYDEKRMLRDWIYRIFQPIEEKKEFIIRGIKLTPKCQKNRSRQKAEVGKNSPIIEQEPIILEEEPDCEASASPSSILIKKKNQEITELFDYYKQEFKKMTGKTPIFNWGKCVKLAKPHLETLGLKTMKHLVYCYLYKTKGEDRKFFKENVWSLSCFLSANTINKINLKYYESN
ncbi:MAG: hypothetical protein HF967_03665 [Methanosarcinales archaeon]|nr:hypothetical protein [Methanosarcinales archaeon]